MKRKLMTSALIIAMLAVLVAGASLAYFTDEETANNTFTVGNVDISLTEPAWQPNDSHVIMPGKTIAKDPTVTVDANSQDCWLFVEIDWSRYVPYIDNAIKLGIIGSARDLAISEKREAFFNAYVEGFDHSKWVIMNADEIISVLTTHKDGEAWPAYLNIKLGYKDVLSANDKVVIFTGITMPKESTQKTMRLFYEYANGTEKQGPNEVDINIKAHAIQRAELNDLDAAYAALFPAKTE